MMVRVPLNMCLLVVSAAAQAQVTGDKLNTTGPTVEQIHAAVIKFDREPISAFRGRTAGPIVRGSGKAEFSYDLPDGSQIWFGKCDGEHRCDFALLRTVVGKGTTAEVKAANDAMFACQELYGDDNAPIKAVELSDYPGEVSVVQRMLINNGTSEDYIHRIYYPTFVECASDARAQLSKK